MHHPHDELQPWEKWPIWLLMGANGVMIFHWFTAPYLPPWLAWLLSLFYVAGGLAAAVAIDGAMVATTMARRAGRNGAWSHASAAVATGFGALVALDLHNALEIGAWIHALFAVLIFTYLQHLAQVRRKLSQGADDLADEAADDAPVISSVREFIRVRSASLLAEQPSMTIGQLAATLGTHPDTVRRALGTQARRILAATPTDDEPAEAPDMALGRDA